MVIKKEASSRFKADHGWLQTYHLFSFADYYDPQNMNFGTLRVFNDDYIAGHQGFGAHNHDNMEIITIVHEGELTHQDSMGNTGVIRAGDVQYMSAGSGVTHAERNEGDETVHVYQIWIAPTQENLSPIYEQKKLPGITSNKLVPIGLQIRTNASLFIATLEQGKGVDYAIDSGRGVFLYVKSGALNIAGVQFEQGDQARIVDEETITITADHDAEFILIDVPV